MDSNTMRNKSVGYAIARERQRQGLTQEELANMVGISDHARISRIENGKQAANLKILYKMADVFGVKVSYFFTDI